MDVSTTKRTPSFPQRCAKCGNEFRGEQCPTCRETETPAVQINNALGKLFLPCLIGLSGVAVAIYAYPAVERSFLPVIATVLFFLPLILNTVSSARKRLVADASRLKLAYSCCGAGVMLIALVIAMNGALDWRPTMVVRARIVGMRVTSGKYSSTYHLDLASWRPGRTTEDIAVGSGLYARASVGRQVAVEVHPGLFGLPWYRKVTLE